MHRVSPGAGRGLPLTAGAPIVVALIAVALIAVGS